MDDYKAMYYKLFNRITDVIELLKEAQTEAEEMFISHPKGQNDKDILFKNNEVDFEYLRKQKNCSLNKLPFYLYCYPLKKWITV